jgi:sterol desaturase/sphingolipid hydroxylase (fatty acid hydroxylase superfamily)
LALLEFVNPLIRRRQRVTPNRIINVLLLVFTIGISRLLVGISAVSAAIFADLNNIGLFNVFIITPEIGLIASIVLLDFFVFIQHMAMHSVPFLWRFHQVHHTDVCLDTTTGFRFHPGEIVLSTAYKWLVICLLGVSPVAVVIFEIILSSFSLFTHSNSRLSSRLQKVLERLIITPAAHWIHHSAKISESQKNFGFCLCLWDKLFKTYVCYSHFSVVQLKFGVTGVKSTRNNFKDLLLQPFQRRNDWNYLIGKRGTD